MRLSSHRLHRPRSHWLLLALAVAVGAALACAEPADSDLDRLRARNALALEEPAWARLYFGRVLERRPDDVEALRGLAASSAEGAEAQLTRAIEALERLVVSGAATGDDRLQLADAYRRLGDRDRALEWLEGIEGVAAEASRARLWLDSEPERGLDAVLRALEERPDDAGLFELRAQLELRLGKTDAALVAARTARRLGPLRSTAPYLEAQCLRRLGDADGAAAALEHFSALRELGSPASGLDADAAASILRPLAASENGAAAWARLVGIWLRSGARGEARAALGGPWPPGVTADEFFSLAAAAQDTGDVGLALRLYDAALDLDPDHVRAAARAARLAFGAGDLGETRRRTDEMRSRQEDLAPAAYLEGLLELSSGDAARAGEHLGRAVELAPWVAAYRLALADVLWTEGRFAETETLIDDAPAPDPAIQGFRAMRFGQPGGVRGEG